MAEQDATTTPNHDQEERDVIVLGAGLAGASCVQALREAGFAGSVLMVGSETSYPYHRPPLTKGFLRGQAELADALVQSEQWYDEHDVELLLGATVTAIDTDATSITLEDGRSFGYHTLVLATGAEPRMPDWPGDGDRAGRVHTVRTVQDAAQLRELLGEGTRLAVVGGGFIGVEAAASALMRGCEVELVLQEDVMWETHFGRTAGAYFQGVIEEHGAAVHTGEEVERIDVVDGAVRLTTRSGRVVEADHVLVAVGVDPRIQLAQVAGIACDSGVLCDSHLRTSAPGVYAVGDIAEYESVVHHGERVRIEHWAVANGHGAYVGKRIAGALEDDQPYDTVPVFGSMLGEWAKVMYVGPGEGDEVVRGDVDSGSFAVAWVDGADRLVALLASDRDDDLAAAKELLAEHARMDRTKLADGNMPLREAVSGAYA